MSVSSMANLALNRRSDFAQKKHSAQKSVTDIEQGKAPPPGTQTSSGATLASISAYIPTEVITLYVAAIGALGTSTSGTSTFDVGEGGRITFAIFLVLTPIVVWLIYAGKVVAAGKSLPTAYCAWPVWEMVAATISFAVWGAAMPNSPVAAWIPPAVSAVLIVVVSGLLGLIAPIVQRPLTIPG